MACGTKQPLEFLPKDPPEEKFAAGEAVSGIVLLLAALSAFILANSAWRDAYSQLWQISLPLYIGRFQLLEMSSREWVNNGLMTLFFLVAGLEIKREIKSEFVHKIPGALGRAILPIAAAFGGILVPAIIYYVCAQIWGGDSRGFGIPVATDIAFSLAVLAVFGASIPGEARLFLTTLAIADDLGAVLIITLFYLGAVSTLSLFWALLVLGALSVANVFKLNSMFVYIFGGLLFWYAIVSSGIHGAIAGIFFAAVVPMQSGGPLSNKSASSTLERLESFLHPISVWFVMPVFAFANAGIELEPQDLVYNLLSPTALAVFLGLFIGKQSGIFWFSWIAIRSGITSLPRRMTLAHLYGIACLGGIGFTMSLYIATLAFETDASALLQAKLGIMTASGLSGALGFVLLLRAARAERAVVHSD